MQHGAPAGGTAEESAKGLITCSSSGWYTHSLAISKSNGAPAVEAASNDAPGQLVTRSTVPRRDRKVVFSLADLYQEDHNGIGGDIRTPAEGQDHRSGATGACSTVRCQCPIEMPCIEARCTHPIAEAEPRCGLPPARDSARRC